MLDPALRQARLTGLLYLVIIVSAGFAEGFVRSGVFVAGDPSETAARILAAPTLFRAGFFADLIAFTADAAVAVLLYLLLRTTNQTIALMAAAFRLVAHPAIGALNLLNHWAALRILESGGPLSDMSGPQAEGFAMLALELHGTGYVVAGAFFGVHCALLGYLLFRSIRFPRALGVLLALAGAGYLFECWAVFMAPALEPLAATLVVATAGVGEVALCLYLLVRGLRPLSPGVGWSPA